MKNIEWLKERLAYYEREVDYGQYEIKTPERHNAVGKVDAINKINEFINEMGNNDEAIKVGIDLKMFADLGSAENEHTTVVPSEMETTSRTVSKKEIVEIPQFVADWILINKNIEIDYAFKLIKNRAEAGTADDFDKWVKKNKNLFAHAFVAGYTIEQPKLLTVIVKDYDKTIMTKKLPEDEVNKMMEGME